MFVILVTSIELLNFLSIYILVACIYQIYTIAVFQFFFIHWHQISFYIRKIKLKYLIDYYISQQRYMHQNKSMFDVPNVVLSSNSNRWQSFLSNFGKIFILDQTDQTVHCLVLIEDAADDISRSRNSCFLRGRSFPRGPKNVSNY